LKNVIAKFTTGRITTREISLAVPGGKDEKMIRDIIAARNNHIKLQYTQMRICL